MTALVPLTAAAVALACGGRLAAGNPATLFSTFSSDSRTLRAGDAFIALQGPTYDGHAFVSDAVARGARGVIASAPAAVAGVRAADVAIILVDDTLGALHALARHVRRASAARVVAITGSAGKTTTKEIAATLLATRYRTLRNRGNLNNHIGLPLSLLELQAGADVAVVELGMNHAGEIATLVAIAEPDIRVWTNVGTAHLAHFGTMDAIAAAKAEILEAATPASVLIANADDPRVMQHVARFAGRTVTFGVESPADVGALAVQDRGIDGQRARVQTPAGEVEIEFALPGRGHLANLLAAVAVAVEFSVPLDAIARAAAGMRAATHRGEVLHLARGVRVFDDCYNASPSALLGTLQIVAATGARGRKLAVLGEMLELGPQAETLHHECGRAAATSGIQRLIVVGGPPARALGEGAREAGLSRDAVTHVESSVEAAELIAREVHEGDLVLVKGSRGVHLERVVERLQAELA
jgi:UDP-N-acetylmuramoyl-tripeptide--D-alanyl-D-alanine ligase